MRHGERRGKVQPAVVERAAGDDALDPITGVESEDVDLGEEAGDAAEDDTFLVEEEEDGDNMSGLLDTGGKEDEEEV